MKYKYSLLLLLLLASSINAIAQDLIYKMDGSIVPARVRNVGTATITYHKFDNQKGPEYTMLRLEIDKIVYEDGSVKFITGQSEKEGRVGKIAKVVKFGQKHPNNIISLIPVAYTAGPFIKESYLYSISDLGVGLTYERLIDRDGHFGLYVPFIINFPSAGDFKNNAHSSTSPPYNVSDYHSYYLAPGIRFYPAIAGSKLRYSFGGALFALIGSEPYFSTSYFSSEYTNRDYKIVGLSIANSVSVMLSKHICIEAGANICIPFSDSRLNDEALESLLSHPLFQFYLKTGLQF